MAGEFVEGRLKVIQSPRVCRFMQMSALVEAGLNHYIRPLASDWDNDMSQRSRHSFQNDDSIHIAADAFWLRGKRRDEWC